MIDSGAAEGGGQGSGIIPSQRTKTDPLPEALMRYMVKLYLVAAATCIVTITLLLYTKRAECLFFLSAAAFILFKAFSVRSSYLKGEIAEIVANCESIRLSAVKDRFSVTFSYLADTDEQVRYQTFVIYGKGKADDFAVNGTYLLYYSKSSPSELIAYICT